MLLILMGLGQNTVVATVVLYSLLPIVKNTYVGLVNVDPMYIDSAKGIGMNRYQILYMIKIPLAGNFCWCAQCVGNLSRDHNNWFICRCRWRWRCDLAGDRDHGWRTDHYCRRCFMRLYRHDDGLAV